MTDKRIIQYKMGLKGRYTGMTEEIMRIIEGIKVNSSNDIELDFNRDGKFDKKDSSLAGRALRKSRKVN